MDKMIRIIAKRDGFRRCGMAHPETATLHPTDTFTPEQMQQLISDPMLLVDLVSVDEDGQAEVVASPPSQVRAAKAKAEGKQ